MIKDTLNLENAQAAFAKSIHELRQIMDYIENGQTWLGKVRGLVDEEQNDR